MKEPVRREPQGPDRQVHLGGRHRPRHHQIGVGSNRYRVTFKGPGGHSYGAFGMANPIQAMGRAIAKIDELQVPAQPKTTFNVGRVGGGTSVNAIPFEGWMEVDMRSADPASLKSLDDRFHAVIRSRRWKRRTAAGTTGERSRVSAERVGAAAGRQDRRRKARSCGPRWRSRGPWGLQQSLREGSTDSNVPMSLGIPAITIGGGGRRHGRALA